MRSQTPRKTVRPQLTDVLVFEQPVGKVEVLRLTVPARNIGEEGDIRIEIPASMIQKTK